MRLFSRFLFLFPAVLLLGFSFFSISLSAKENGTKDTSGNDAVLKEENLSIDGTRFKADSLNGVTALYRSGVSSSTDGTNSVYSCAAYIKKYYNTIYGVDVSNLNNGCTPAVPGDSFIRVSTPCTGDIVSLPNHWAIVKSVNPDSTITLIEQNYKWSQGSSYMCRINRRISCSSASYFRLSSVDRQMNEIVNTLTPIE